MAIIYNPDTGQYEEDQGGPPPTNTGPNTPPVSTGPTDTGPAPQSAGRPSYDSFSQFWNEFQGMDLAEAARVWNLYHTGNSAEHVTPVGHSGDAFTYRGKTYDGIYNVGSPDQRKQFIEVGGGGGDPNGGGNGGGDFALNPDYLAPFTTPFEPGADTQLPTPPGGQPFAYPDFNVPDPSKIALDPSYQFRLNQGIDAIKSNKAAMGTLNTGGTIKDYLNYGQGAASQEYSNIFDRNFRTWGANRDNAFGSWAANTTQANTGFGQQKSLADDAYSRAWQKYRGLEDTFRANQNGPSQKLLALANIGSSAASV